MKKIFCFIFTIALTAVFFTGCGNSSAQTGRFSIVCTTFPQYDWLREITAGTDTELTFLLDSGVDLHSFQPTADDIIKISGCNMFVYVGGESDNWVDDALKNAPGVTAVNLIELLGDSVKEEEAAEGMETEESDEDEPENDEHIWLSLRNAGKLCKAVSDILCEKDSSNKEKYSSNTENYIKRLEQLDSEYQTAVDSAEVRTLLFGDRFPFRYLTDDYGIKYYGAFAGCSAETEASFETIAFLAQKVDELGLSHVMTTENSDGKIAQTIIENTEGKNQDILAMDSMQSATKKDVDDGITYISVMEKNLDVLKKALDREAV